MYLQGLPVSDTFTLPEQLSHTGSWTKKAGQMWCLGNDKIKEVDDEH